jgi:hypothetical protein
MVKAKRAHISGNAETAKLLPKVARAVFLSRQPHAAFDEAGAGNGLPRQPSTRPSCEVL